MPTLKDLGKKLKDEFPNKFDHLTDEEVGEAAKRAARHKGLNMYAEYEEEAGGLISMSDQCVFKQDVFGGIIRDLSASSETERIAKAENYTDELDYYLNPHRGVLTGWFQNRKSVKREELARNLGAEKSAVFNQAMVMAEAVRNGTKREIEYKRFVVENATALLEARSKVNRIIEADKLNVPETNYTELRVQELSQAQELDHHQKRAAFDANLEVSKTRQLTGIETDAKIEIAELESNLRITEFTERDKIEWQRYRNEKELDVQAAIIANIAPVFEANALTTQLFGVIDEMQQLQLNPMDEATRQKIQALKRTKKYLERCINERFEGLLQSNPRKSIRAVEEDGENP